MLFFRTLIQMSDLENILQGKILARDVRIQIWIPQIASI